MKVDIDLSIEELEKELAEKKKIQAIKELRTQYTDIKFKSVFFMIDEYVFVAYLSDTYIDVVDLQDKALKYEVRNTVDGDCIIINQPYITGYSIENTDLLRIYGKW